MPRVMLILTFFTVLLCSTLPPRCLRNGACELSLNLARSPYSGLVRVSVGSAVVEGTLIVVVVNRYRVMGEKKGVVVVAGDSQLCMNMSSRAEAVVSPTVSDFFNITGNLTTVTWAHAVNSRAELSEAINDTTIMMFEADIVMGTLNTTNSTDLVPVMGHPPANESDLSLEEFLNTVLADTKRGVKLDFKTIEVFNASREILAKVRPNMTFPVWINADILPGPVNATGTPVDAAQFLSGAAETFPESTLSIGWTTRYGTTYDITEGAYSTDQVNEMLNTTKTNGVTQPITYPVRAGLAAQSIDAMQTLVDGSPDGTTLTIWSSDGDAVDTDKLSELILKIGVGKVYIDVPDAVWEGLRIASGASASGLALGSTLAALAIGRLV